MSFRHRVKLQAAVLSHMNETFYHRANPWLYARSGLPLPLLGSQTSSPSALSLGRAVHQAYEICASILVTYSCAALSEPYEAPLALLMGSF